MKSFAVALLVAVGGFLLADEARVAIVRQLIGCEPDAWFLGASVIIQAAFGYTAPFFAAGVVTAWVFPLPRRAVLVALLVGLAIPLASLISGSPQPFAFSTHGPLWLNTAGWSNWFAPPVAAVLGVLLAKRIRPNFLLQRTATPPAER